MRRVYKYPIPVMNTGITLQIPRGYKVVGFGHQGDPAMCVVWAEVNPEVEELEEKTYHVFGTGHDIEDDTLVHVAIVNVWQAQIVWHIYEEKGK